MKRLTTIIFILFSLSANAQNRANVWELSYSTDLINPNCEMRYDNGQMDTNKVFRVMSFTETNASICDTNGNLLFYSNGLIIGNKNYDTLQNSAGFNPGFTTDLYEPDGMSIPQAVLILPYPGYNQRYGIFSISGELFPFDIQPLQLKYSVIDMELDNGLGGIIDSIKGKYLLEDTLANGGLTAVKHANGRDWWLLIPRYHSGFYKLLLTPNGIQDSSFQSIGSIVTDDYVVESQFSPDGSKFCLANAGGTFDYLEFDRCSGMFANQLIGYSPDLSYFFGCAFSPNNRFLYLTTPYNLYQYDTWDSDMITNVIHIAAWDSFYDSSNIPVLFATQQLAPDGKIYVSPWNGVKYFNVINDPDSLGISCNFQPHSYVIPQYNDGIPSFPNYDLGPLEGSSCDTIIDIPTGVKPSYPNSTFTLSPNPVSSWLNIVYLSSADGFFELFDINGKQVASGSLYHYFRNRLFDVSGLPTGVYLATVKQNGKQVWSEQVVVAH